MDSASPPPSPSYLADDSYVPLRLTPAVRWLIGINVLIYFLQVTAVGTPDMERWLGFEVHGLTRQWWTIFTYMFVHAGFWHLTFNMITLWAFGPKVERAWGSGAFVRYYLLCGLGGWLAHLLIAHDAMLIGASAAIFGVMLAYAVRWPNDEFLLWWVVPVKAKWLVACLALFNLILGVYALGTIDVGGGTAYFAHLGGLAAGWLYLHTPPAQAFERFRQRVAAAPEIPDEPPHAIPRTLSRPHPHLDEIVAKSKAAVLRQRRAPAAPTHEAKATTDAHAAAQLDLVLDKISRQGLDSLTSDERRVLEEMSRRLRKG
jgi:membrane associated rhomboid family serine protease